MLWQAFAECRSGLAEAESALPSELKEKDHDGHGDDAKQRGDDVDEARVFAVVSVEMGHLRDGGGTGRGGRKKADEQNGASVLRPGGEGTCAEDEKREKGAEREGAEPR